MRIAIPLKEKKGMESRIEEHFGRTRFFAIYDSESGQLEEIEVSKAEHGTCSPARELLRLGVDAIFVLGMGAKARMLFEENGIRVFTGNFRSVQEVVENIDKLERFSGGCGKW